MITSKDLIIGQVTTKEIQHGSFFLPSQTYEVTEIIKVKGMKCYVTNRVHKVYPDGTFDPLVITENMVKKFKKIKP